MLSYLAHIETLELSCSCRRQMSRIYPLAHYLFQILPSTFVSHIIYIYALLLKSDSYSIVGLATCYELDGSGIESRWGRDFLHTSRPALGPTQPLIQSVPCLFPWGEAAGVLL